MAQEPSHAARSNLDLPRDMRYQSRIMRITRLTGIAGTIALLLATLTAASAQTSQMVSLNGTWDFALAPDAAAADRLAAFYQDGFQGGNFRPIPVPSNWALQGFEEPISARARQGRHSDG